MISKSFGLLFYLKKHHGDTKVHRPIYLRITVDGVQTPMKLTTSRRFKLTTLRRLKLTTPRRSKLTT